MFKGKLGIKVLASTLVVATVAGVSLVHVSRAKANESQPWQSACIEASEYEDTLSTQILKDNIGKMDDMSVDELLELVESEEYNRQFHRMMNKVMGTERNRVTRGGSGQEDEFTDEDCFEEENIDFTEEDILEEEILSEEEYADEEDIDLNEQEETKDEYAISEGPSSIVTEEELEGCEVSEGPATMDNVDFEELDSEEDFDTTEETDVEVDESEELDITEDDSTKEDNDTTIEKDEQEGVEPVKEETSKLKRKFEIVKKHIGEYVDKVMAELPKVIKKVLGEQLRKMITHAVKDFCSSYTEGDNAKDVEKKIKNMSEKSKVNEQIVKVVYDLVVAIIDKVVPLPDDGYSLKDDCDINIKNTEEYIVSHNGKKLEKNHDYKVSISAEFKYVLATDEEIATDEYAIYMEEYDKEGRTRQENEKRAEETGEDITNIVYTKRILKKIATFEFTGLNNYYGKSVITYATVVTENEFNLYRQRFEK